MYRKNRKKELLKEKTERVGKRKIGGKVILAVGMKGNE